MSHFLNGSRSRRTMLVVFGLAMVIGAPAWAEDATAAKTVEIAIDNFTFTPAEVTIAPGTTVHWTNKDDIPHLVAEKNLAWKSKALDTGDGYTHVFTDPGEVVYFCAIHPHMTGKIIVK